MRRCRNRHRSAAVRRRRSVLALAIGFLLLAPSVGLAQYGVPFFDVEADREDFRLVSPAFEGSEMIPSRYTCDSRNVSPPLEWEQSPVRTESFALIMDDPDAPVGTWVHWVLFNIPSAVTTLPEGVSRDEALSDGSRQGRNSFGDIGYGGPCPPRGPEHRYVFRLYALDTMLDLAPGATKEELLGAIEDHVLARTKLVGRYGR